jgi:hypothetical protein
MNMAREPFPGLVHQARALVAETVTVAVHHDPIGVEQDDRRGALAARVHRLDVHAVPLAGDVGAERPRHGDTVTGVETRARRKQRDAVPARTKMLPHHVAVALETAAGKHHRIGGKNLAAAHAHAANAILFSDQRLCRACVAEPNAGLVRGAGELTEDRRAAADRLDARRAFGEIIGRLMKLDAVRRDPLHRRGRLMGEAGEVAFVALEFRRFQHVVHEARLDAIGRGHAHVGRRPAGIAAGLVRGSLVDKGDGDARIRCACLFGRGQRCRKPCRALTDNNDLEWLGAHLASPSARRLLSRRSRSRST